MVNKVLRGSTCGSLNLPVHLGCDKCKPSLERLRDTGKIRRRKITTCEKMWDDKWINSGFAYKRKIHLEVKDYLKGKSMCDEITNEVNSTLAAECQTDTSQTNPSNSPSHSFERLTIPSISIDTVNLSDEWDGEQAFPTNGESQLTRAATPGLHRAE